MESWTGDPRGPTGPGASGEPGARARPCAEPALVFSPRGSPRGRPRRVKPMLKAVSIGALLLMMVALVGLWVTHSLFSPSPFAIAAQCAAVALMIWARLTFGGRSFHAAANP